MTVRRASRPQRGSVLLVGKTWRVRFRMPGAAGGPRRRVSHRLGTVAELETRAAARRAADRLLAQLAPQGVNAASVVAWSRWCERYETQHLPLLARGTRETRRSILRRHLALAPAFAGLALHEIGQDRIQQFVLDQLQAGVAPSTIRTHYALLRRLLRAAADAGLAATPPRTDKLEFPRATSVEPAVRAKAFTPDEVQRILETAVDPLRTACALARGIGLRAGEVCGLTWSAIDLEAARLDLRQQALDGQVRPLKSRSSRAVLYLPPDVVAQLRRYREAWQPNAGEFLFATDDGRPLDAAVLRQQLHELLDELGIKRRGLHGLRHAFALAMAGAGVNPEAMRKAMRHSSLRTTSIYLTASDLDIANAIRIGSANGPAVVPTNRTTPQEIPTPQHSEPDSTKNKLPPGVQAADKFHVEPVDREPEER